MAEAIFKSACSLSGLPHVAKEIGHYLCLREDFVILLQGDMGVGKTTFVSHLLRSFGLGEDTPVVSPTYTIMNEYKIDSDWFAHLDLYRFDSSSDLDDLGIGDTRRFKGIFIEWPSMATGIEHLCPTHCLKIGMPDLDSRTYVLEGLSG